MIDFSVAGLQRSFILINLKFSNVFRGIKREHWKKRVHHIFILFTFPEYLEAYLKTFRNFVNCHFCHYQLRTKSKTMCFRDVQISHEEVRFTTSFYHNPTFSGFQAHFDRF